MDVRELITAIEVNSSQYYQLLNGLNTEQYEAPQNEMVAIQQTLKNLTSIQDEVVDFRLRKIVKEEHPYLPQINPTNSFYHTASLQWLTDTFLKQRENLMGLLRTLPFDQWERTGVHEKEGHVSFLELVRRLVEKDRKILELLNQKLELNRTTI